VLPDDSARKKFSGIRDRHILKSAASRLEPPQSSRSEEISVGAGKVKLKIYLQFLEAMKFV